MSPKVGRPRSVKPKEIRFSIRLDIETEIMLQRYCAKHKISKGEAIRQGIYLLLNEKADR